MASNITATNQTDNNKELAETTLSSINTASNVGRALYTAFMALTAYIMVTLGSTDDLKFFDRAPLILPLLNVEISLTGFYRYTPWLYVIIHANLLLVFSMIAEKHRYFAELADNCSWPVRVNMRQQLHVNAFIQFLGANHQGLLAFILKLMIWFTVGLMPPLLLLFIQLDFLAAQIESVTRWQQTAVLVDSFLAGYFWNNILQKGRRARFPKDWNPPLWKRYLLEGWVLWVSTVFIVGFSGLIAVVPLSDYERRIYNHMPKLLRSDETDCVIEKDIDILRGQINLILDDSLRDKKQNQLHNISNVFIQQLVDATKDAREWDTPYRCSNFLTWWFIDRPKSLLTEQLGIRRWLKLPNKVFVENRKTVQPKWLNRLKSELGSNVKNTKESIQLLSENTQKPSDIFSSSTFKIMDYFLPINKEKQFFRFADFRQSFFPKAKMMKAELQGADLSGAMLHEVNLNTAFMRGVNLSKARLNRANLKNAELLGADLNHSNLRGADLTSARLPGVNLNHADLRGADLSYVHLECVNLNHDEQKCANLNNAKLQGVTLSGAYLRGANLTEAKLHCEDLSHTDQRGEKLINTDQQQCADLRGAGLQDVDLTNAQLQAANLSSAYLQGADLSRTKLQDANLSGSQLQRAILYSAKLQGADLYKANLQEANLTGSNLLSARLKATKFQGANITNTRLQATDLSNANLQGTNLTHADLQGAYLVEANLQGAKLQFVNLQGADLRNAQMQGIILLGDQLDGVQLLNAKLDNALILTSLGINWGEKRKTELLSRKKIYSSTDKKKYNSEKMIIDANNRIKVAINDSFFNMTKAKLENKKTPCLLLTDNINLQKNAKDVCVNISDTSIDPLIYIRYWAEYNAEVSCKHKGFSRFGFTPKYKVTSEKIRNAHKIIRDYRAFGYKNSTNSYQISKYIYDLAKFFYYKQLIQIHQELPRQCEARLELNAWYKTSKKNSKIKNDSEFNKHFLGLKLDPFPIKEKH